MERPPRILIAEDEKEDVAIMKTILEETGLAGETAVVRDGVEALDYLHRRGAYAARAEGNPDLLLLDLKLPKVTGMEVLGQIRGDAGFKSIRVVIFSSSLDEKDRKESLARGADEFAVKPIQFEEFQQVMTRLVNTYIAG